MISISKHLEFDLLDISNKNKMKKIGVLLIFLMCVTGSFAQKGILKTADTYYEKIAYALAAENYEKLRGSKIEEPQMLARLANCYYQMGHTEKAEEVFGLMINDPTANYDDYYRYAMTLKENKKYDESELWLSKFTAAQQSDVRAKAYTKNANYLEDLRAIPLRFDIKNLAVNTEHTDFGGYFNPNNKEILIVSNRAWEGFVQRDWSGNNLPFLDIFSGSVGTNMEIEDVKMFSKRVNTKFHEGPIAFSPNGRRVYFTRNNLGLNGKHKYDDKGIQNLKLYYAEVDAEGNWINIKEAPYNSQAFSVGHPTVSSDGKTLYFSSDMPGGFGGADIYKATIAEGLEDVVFGTPINLGSKINTEGQEMFPWVDVNGNLFFSSDGHPGFGGLDIFVSQKSHLSNLYLAENLGAPINENRDDFAFIMNLDGETGYFSSNRKTGKGDDDIYSFTMLEPLTKPLNVCGRILVSRTGELIPGAKIDLKDNKGVIIAQTVADDKAHYCFVVERGLDYSLIVQSPDYFDNTESFSTTKVSPEVDQIQQDVELIKDPGIGAYLLVTNRRTGQPLKGVKVKILDLYSGKVVMDDLTASTGDLIKPLTENRIGDCLKYQIILQKEGYLSKTVLFNHCIDQPGLVSIHQKLDLGMDTMSKGDDIGKILKINPIYFDLNKSNIRPDAALELAKIVQVMNDNPTLEIELGSHTDCRASYAYNEKLSDRRAKSSAAWVRSKITNPQRIYGKGYGESRLLNDCSCEGNEKSDCSEEEHQLNRRTEFIIIKM